MRSIRADDPNLKSFETLFASGKPRCGQARDSQREFLFGSDANDIGSIALVPLGEKGSVGLLAIGSTDRDRFHPGMSTEFLARMGDLIADALNPRGTSEERRGQRGPMTPAALDWVARFRRYMNTERRLSAHTDSNYARDLARS